MEIEAFLGKNVDRLYLRSKNSLIQDYKAMINNIRYKDKDEENMKLLREIDADISFFDSEIEKAATEGLYSLMLFQYHDYGIKIEKVAGNKFVFNENAIMKINERDTFRFNFESAIRNFYRPKTIFILLLSLSLQLFVPMMVTMRYFHQKYVVE